jgi:single-stranded-DNA-specific exonuclease
MPDMDRAAQRLLDAAHARQHIVIYGDYDVDGISATAILFHTLRHLAPNAIVSTYVPHRLEEGYGLNSDALRSLASQGAKVVVSVDCGVTAVQPALDAVRAGIDLIITDHHNPPASVAELPPAYAVVHPRRPDSSYPFGDLSGSAVAYKLAWRLCTLAAGSPRVSNPTRELLLDLLALASLGVIADIVPLVGENRVIARFGLSRLKTCSLVGIRSLIDASGLSGDRLDAYDVGFKLAPRLNACGRLGHAREAVELFTTADEPRAAAIAHQLTALNNERRAVERAITDTATELAQAAGMTSDNRRAIVLAHHDWHQGVVGIACSRLVSLFHRPTILLAARGDECHGSGRSIDGFNLHHALESCRDSLLSFGGHDMAAGLRLHASRLPEFTERFIDHANNSLSTDHLTATLLHDSDAQPHELSLDAVRELARLAPFGRDNPPVRLRLTNIRLDGRPRPLGADGKHASLFVRSRSHDHARVLRLVGWDWAARLADLPAGAPLEAVVEPKISTFSGTPTVEAELLDLRLLHAAPH